MLRIVKARLKRDEPSLCKQLCGDFAQAVMHPCSLLQASLYPCRESLLPPKMSRKPEYSRSPHVVMGGRAWLTQPHRFIR